MGCMYAPWRYEQAALGTRQSEPCVLHLPLLVELITLLCWVSAAVFAARAANTLSRWRATRRAELE